MMFFVFISVYYGVISFVSSSAIPNDTLIFPDQIFKVVRNATIEKEQQKSLFKAASEGNEDAVRELIQKGADVNGVNDDGESALHAASLYNKEKVIELLLKSGANVNIADRRSDTPLHWAAIRGHENIIDVLLRNGANFSLKNWDEQTALHIAASNGNYGIVNLLIRSGAIADAKGNYDNTPLHLASRISSLDSEKIIDLLIENEVDVNALNREKETPLHLAVRYNSASAVAYLIRSGADVNVKNGDGITALFGSIIEGDDDRITDMLIQNGANIYIRNQNGDTALHLAVQYEREKIIDLLIQNGLDVDVMNDNNGNTPLHIAVNNTSINYVKILLQHHANPRVKNKNGQSPVDLAEIKHFIESWVYLSTEQSGAQEACDMYSQQLADRILGGDLAESGEFPWMAALGYLDKNYRISFDCGGTIISDYFILTAAHCVKESYRPVVVRMGKLSLSDEGDTKAKNYQIREIIQHPFYSAGTKKNDIALIRVVKCIVFSDLIRPACLQTDLHDEDSNVKLIVTGWGIVSTAHRNRSTELRKTDLQTMSLSECNSTILNFNAGVNQKAFRHGISKSQYCAFDPNGKKDSCQGDSGGPLQAFPFGAVLSRVIGIVSFGISCGTEWPGIYTRVAYYVPWIESHVWPYEPPTLSIIDI